MRPASPADLGTRSKEALRILRINGFLVETIHYAPNMAEFFALRSDPLLAGALRYVIGVVDGAVAKSQLDYLHDSAERQRAALVIVADEDDSRQALAWSEFVGRLGGPVPSSIPFDATYGTIIEDLGRNLRPSTLPDGRIEDLYESFVGAGLEFVTATRVIRYGVERRFEAVPDGLVLPGSEHVTFLYDAKAADPSFEITRDDVRRFADYTKRHNRMYGQHTGPVRAFLLVSSAFKQGPAARRAHSDQLVADAGVPICFVTSGALAECASFLGTRPWIRRSIRWTRVLSSNDLRLADLKAAADEIHRDAVLP